MLLVAPLAEEQRDALDATVATLLGDGWWDERPGGTEPAGDQVSRLAFVEAAGGTVSG